MVTENKDKTNNFKFENFGVRGASTEEEPMDAEEVEERESDGYDPDKDEDNAPPFDETEAPNEGYGNNVNNDKKLTLQERKEKQADLMERWDNFLSKVKTYPKPTAYRTSTTLRPRLRSTTQVNTSSSPKHGCGGCTTRQQGNVLFQRIRETDQASHSAKKTLRNGGSSARSME